ncbi:MAG: efflux RND transporter permease subunit [Spirochaetota bacterium]
MQEPKTSREQGFSIGKFSVSNPVLVTILIFSVVVLGVFSLVRLPQEQFSEVPFYWVNVIVPYPGVGAEDIETSVTIPVENAFQGISQLKQISSVTSEGLSVVRVEFDDGISNEQFRSLYQEAQTRFSRVELPDGVLSPTLDDFSSADFLPVIEVVLSGNLPYEVLREEAHYLRDRLLRVSDVSDVEITGLPEREIRVAVDPTRLASLGLTTDEIVRALQDHNRTIPSGILSTERRDYLLRTLGGLNSVDDIGDLIVRQSQESGGIIRVDDVATVVDGFNPDAPVSRFDGSSAVNLKVTKIPRGSSVAVAEGTKQIVREAERELAPGTQLALFNDSTIQIDSSISVLTTNAMMGLGLLVLILWLFIGLRNALMTALGIPVTFALTFIVLDLLGETVNTNTLFGLVLVLGLIVDHAIVIIENSYRLQQNGLLRRDAAIVGTNQVVLPIIAATATTIAAFLPLMLIPGTIGKFLRVIPLTVTIALLASTGEALFFLPSHFADWGKDRKQPLKKKAGAWFSKVQRGYGRLINLAYRGRVMFLILLVVIAAGAFSLIGTLRQDLFAAEDFSYFTIDITMPPGTPIGVTDAFVGTYERVLLPKIGDGEILSVSSIIGAQSNSSNSLVRSNTAQITVDLIERGAGRRRGIDEIIEEIEEETYYIPGAEQVFFRKAQNGPPTPSALSYRLFGDDYQMVLAAAADIRTALSGFEGVTNIEDDYETGSPEIQIRLKPERAAALGVQVATLGNYLRTRFEGVSLGTLFENNEEIEMVLTFENGQNHVYEDLVHSFIPTSDGRLIPFSSVADVEQRQSPGSVRRVEGKREITVTADAGDEVDLGAVDAAVESSWEGELQYRYPDVNFGVGGEFSEFQDLLVEILRVFLLGIFLIYLILGAQFKSYTQPFLILFSIPFAFVGVVLYLALSGTPFSTTVLYAGVALAGIAVNDAIVLISFINDRRKEGESVQNAVLSAAKTRLRPIVLTSLTTIVGLLPTALGLGGVSVVWGPMASTIIFGLLFSTLSALFVVPMLYGVLYDRRRKVSADIETN